MKEPDPKRVKPSSLDAFERGVEYYWSYMEDENDDVDVLLEIADVVWRDVTPRPYKITASLSQYDTQQLLLSVVYGILADRAIAEALVSSSSRHDEADDDNIIDARAVELLQRSLDFCRQNAATYSMAANYIRMTKKQQQSSASSIVEYYLQAAELCESLSKMDYEDELVECLIMNQMLGCERVADDGDDTRSDTTEESAGEHNSVASSSESPPRSSWSVSAVACTSRFMAAMLLSSVDADAAQEQLQYFDVSHRLHPNIWTATFSSTPLAAAAAAATPPDEQRPPGPRRFASPVLPAPLYERMCEIFRPDASYWKESGYGYRGYYSFYSTLPDMDDDTLPGRNNNHSNIIDEVVLHHLLPKVIEQSSSSSEEKIVGYEWWIHTRPISANLGHNLHYDTDETSLFSHTVIRHPHTSSVLYLTGGGGGDDDNDDGGRSSRSGATIVLDQTPDRSALATRAWYSAPANNSLLTFPGNLLHGVLPCQQKRRGAPVPTPPLPPSDAHGGGDSSTLLERMKADLGTPQEPSEHRLTFMVGFWTDRIRGEREYGPSGPLPTDAQWVRELENYPRGCPPLVSPPAAALPVVTPAFEALPGGDEKSAALLEIPRALDHRYFCKNPPGCFREALFEKDDC